MIEMIKKLWADECGAVVTAEYLTLGSVVALGSAAGLNSMKEEMNAECQEFGKSLRQVTRQARESNIKVMRQNNNPGQNVNDPNCVSDQCGMGNNMNSSQYLMMVP